MPMLDGKDLFDSLSFGERAAYRRLDLPLKASSLESLSREAFEEIAFRLPTSQLEGFASVLGAPEASGPERFVAASLIRNAAIAAEGVYPLCQDTGDALILGWRGSRFSFATNVSMGGARGDIRGDDEGKALEAGARAAYLGRRLRASVLAPGGFIEEGNNRDNLPAHVDIRSVAGSSYRLCFAAKGGGSANRTSLSMETPALLSSAALEKRLAALVSALGPSGCPPYRISCVLGGLSPDEALYALLLAGLGLLDGLPSSAGDESLFRALRSPEWEEVILRLAEATGTGLQFGGSRLALSARAIRLPRHAASLPLAFGVSCAAQRVARAFIDEEGFFLERMEADPGRFLPAELPLLEGALRVDLDRDMGSLAAELGKLEPGTPLLLSGLVVTARDKAHARFADLVAQGKPLPAYLSEHPVFYAGPTEAAPGEVSGSFGPTTAGRMDGYLELLASRGASLVSIAKGSRSEAASKAIAAHGGAYLCAIGGAAALAGRENIVSSEIIDYPELGMEAVRLVRLRELPAILGMDGRGRDFYKDIAAARAGEKR